MSDGLLFLIALAVACLIASLPDTRLLWPNFYIPTGVEAAARPEFLAKPEPLKKPSVPNF